MKTTSLCSSIALALAASGAAAFPLETSWLWFKRAPNPPNALPQSAPADAITFQPIMDFDKDSCYNVAAIDAQGNVAQGLPSEQTSNTEGCREASFLDNQNVYSRKRCNGGWCAYMYEYYFLKDVALEHAPKGLSGHRHEWEGIVVFVKNGDTKPSYVSTSAHDGYTTRPSSEVRFDGPHAKIVYHKDGISTHAFRFANQQDDAVENDKHQWIRGSLIDWSSWPSTDLRSKMIQGFNGGGIKCKLADDLFGTYLAKAVGNLIPAFNPNKDG